MASQPQTQANVITLPDIAALTLRPTLRFSNAGMLAITPSEQRTDHNAQATDSATPAMHRFPIFKRSSTAYLIGITIQAFLRTKQRRFTGCDLLSPFNFLQQAAKNRPPAAQGPKTTDDHVAKTLFFLFTISTGQMWQGVITPLTKLELKDFQNADDFNRCRPLDDWPKMTTDEIWLDLQKKVLLWIGTFEQMNKCLAGDEQLRQKDFIQQFNDRFDSVHGRLENTMDGIFAFFSKFAYLLSDVEHLVRNEVSPDLRQLKTIPTRADMLHAMIDRAPEAADLAARVLITVFQLPVDKRECTICLTSWNEGFDESTLETCEHARKAIFPWLHTDGKAITVRPGYEGVPLKMKCGHVFCAGCIKTWLDTPGRLECPYRDEDYGVHRAAAIKTISEYHRRYVLDEQARAAKNKTEARAKQGPSAKGRPSIVKKRRLSTSP